AKIMLQREPRPGNQAIRRPPAKLPHEFRALRDARRSQRVTLRYQSAGGVNDAASTIRDIPLSYHLVRLPLLAQTQRIQRDHLIRRETIVQLTHADRLPRVFKRCHPRFPQRCLGGVPCHLEAHERNGAAVEDIGRIGREALSLDQHGPFPQPRARRQKRLRDHHRRRPAVGGGAALQFRQRLMDCGTLHNLLERVDVTELRIRVPGRMLVVHARNLREISGFRAVPFHVFPPRVAEHLRGAGGIGDAAGGGHHRAEGAGGVFAVLEEGGEGAGEHFLETDHHHAVLARYSSSSSADGLAGHP
ncbi:MAG: hypothetical protein Q9203_003813, partial [Teloschistes exilis]